MLLQIVGIYSDIGASKRGSVNGVRLLSQMLETKYKHLVQKEVKIVNDLPIQDCQDKQRYSKNIQTIYEFFKNKLMPALDKVVQEGNFPLIFSGDHSNALGILQVFKKAYQTESIAVIWVDAHSDLHTPYDSPSGNIHGMPLGGVINKAKSGENTLEDSVKIQWEKLCTLSGNDNINPKNIIYIGTRSMEKSEKDMISKFKIPLHSAREIRQDIQKVFQEVVASLNGIERVYMSIDVDVLDSKAFASTGVKENNGLYPDELDTFIKLVIENLSQKLIGIEFTEFNPTVQGANIKDTQILLDIVSNTIDKLECIKKAD